MLEEGITIKMNKMNYIQIKRIIFLILSIVVAMTIFMFSNQDGEKSKTTSKGFTKEIVDVAPPTRNLEEEEKQQIVEDSQPVIRKIAHFSIYTVFGICLFNFFKTFEWTTKKQVIFTLILSMLYAISDEIHQFFLDGRSPLIIDIFIDTFGALFGTVIVFVIGYCLKKKKIKQWNNLLFFKGKKKNYEN